MHGAKGMEFNHVFIADGGWNSNSTSTGIEDERRLFYVAMTRAMETLTVMSVNGVANPHIGLLKSGNCLISEFQSPKTSRRDYTKKQFQILGLKNLYLGFPGTFDQHSRIHSDLEALNPGDSVTLSSEGEGIVILNGDNKVISKLSKTAVPTWKPILPKIEQAKVLAVVKRLKSDEAPDFQATAKTDEWELPLIEVLYCL